MIIKYAFLVLAIILVSCSHSIHLVHTSGFTPYSNPKKGKIITAEAQQHVVLSMVGDTNYVDRAYRQLQSKCKNKNITGITTQFSTSHGFFSWTNKILLKGLCVG